MSAKPRPRKNGLTLMPGDKVYVIARPQLQGSVLRIISPYIVTVDFGPTVGEPVTTRTDRLAVMK